MEQQADVVLEISNREIQAEEDLVVKLLATRLLEKWISDTRENFCTTTINPEIANLKKKSQRRAARHLLHRIQIGLAQKYENGARMQMQHRKSADAMHAETLSTYSLIERIGRGIVYFGSARTKEGGKYYDETEELAFEAASMLKVPTWTGAGPGQMQAPLVGGKKAGVDIGGIKISLNGEQSSFEQDISWVLDKNNVVECKYFGPRKIGLVDAAMRQSEDDKTAIIVTPGGFGTLDEFFEFVVLKQLKKLGTKHPVPIIVMNYDGFYDTLVKFLAEKCVEEGTINEFELDLFHIAESNEEALDILAETYAVAEEERGYHGRIKSTREAASEHRAKREEIANA